MHFTNLRSHNFLTKKTSIHSNVLFVFRHMHILYLLSRTDKLSLHMEHMKLAMFQQKKTAELEVQKSKLPTHLSRPSLRRAI